jgi:hypothetical protein
VLGNAHVNWAVNIREIYVITSQANASGQRKNQWPAFIGFHQRS